MKITKVEIRKLSIPFTTSLKVALGEMTGADNIIVKITTDNGLCGWGEASPFPPITGDSFESAFSMARQFARLLVGKNPLAIAARVKDMRAMTVGDPSIRSAFDIALHDIAAQAANMPLYQFLGGEKRDLRTDLTIGWKDSVQETVASAQAILDAGFDAIKLKVGRPVLQDVPHVRAVRDLVGEGFSLRIDSNQGWDYPGAVQNIEAMSNLNIQYAEQPLAAWDYAGMARLRDKVKLPICADESLFSERDALKLVQAGAADYLNIKLGKAGGIHIGKKINTIAEASGAKCMIGCFAESRLGLSAAAHLAMACPNIAFLDLDSAFSFKSDPVVGGMVFDKDLGGLISLPDVPGLGATIDEKFLDAEIKAIIAA